MNNSIPLAGQNKLSTIKKILINENKKKAPRHFEVFVDNLKVISKTNDVKQFNKYQSFIFDDSKELLFKIYTAQPNSPWCEKHLIQLGTITIEPTNGFNGFDPEIMIEEKIKIQKERWEAELVVKELAETRLELKEAEEYIKKLENINEELKNKKPSVDYSSLIVSVLTKIVKENSNIITKLGLSGFWDSGNKNSEPIRPVEADFPENDDNTTHSRILKVLEARFFGKDLNTIIKILSKIIDDPTLIHTIADLLNIKEENEINTHF